MIHKYHYKIYDLWTPALRRAPRWMAFNLYETLADSPSIPVYTNTLIASSTLELPSSSYIPSGWIGSSSVPSTGDGFQKLFEIFTSELEPVFRVQDTVFSQGIKSFNLADPVFGWAVHTEEDIDTIRLKMVDGSYRLVKRAVGEYDFFYSGEWKWLPFGDSVYLTGLDLLESTTTVVSGWHYVSDEVLWDPTSPIFLEHPVSKTWIMLSPEEVSASGFLNFFSAVPSGSCRIRFRSTLAASALSDIKVEINGEEQLAYRINFWNSLDEHGLLNDNARRDGEANIDYANSHLYNSWFRGQNRRGFRAYLSAMLRTASYDVYSSTTSSITYPASATGFMLKGDIDPFLYVTENLLAEPNDTTSYLTRFDSPSRGTGFLNNVLVNVNTVSGNAFTPSVDSSNRFDQYQVHWKLDIWSDTGSSISLNNVLQRVLTDDIEVLFCHDVDVPNTQTPILKKSFNRSYPLKRWRTQVLDNSDTKVGTLSTFET